MCDFILHPRDLLLTDIGYYLEKKFIRVIHPLDIQSIFSINITTWLGDRHIIVWLIWYHVPLNEKIQVQARTVHNYGKNSFKITTICVCTSKYYELKAFPCINHSKRTNNFFHQQYSKFQMHSSQYEFDCVIIKIDFLSILKSIWFSLLFMWIKKKK